MASRSLVDYRDVCQASLDYIRDQGYEGFNKHDALNSPLLRGLLGHTKWTRIAGIQAVMRAPINLRPWLFVPKTRNPKGLGLYASGLLDLYSLYQREEDLENAKELLDWLLANSADGFQGQSWGYPYPWQDLGFFAPKNYPNRVVTCWIGFAFVEAARQTREPRYLEVLPRIAQFLLEEPNVLFDDDTMKCLSYVPDSSVTWAVMDVSALVGAFLAETGQVLGDESYFADAFRLMNWVADKQTDYAAWYYTHPPGDSLITHDNYHTAIVLDCFDQYCAATGDESFQEVYWRGIEYYQQHLFDSDGAPRFMNQRRFPRDIHGCGSGILCFARAARHRPEYRDQAFLILDWALENLYDSRGWFYYQKTRWYTKRFCLLRWCNGWMFRAMAYLLRSEMRA